MHGLEGQEAVADRRGRKSALLYLLRKRPMARLLVVVPPLLLGFFAVGVSVWRCPLMDATGCRCPGCGLTRALAALARGELPAAFSFHPFALVFALGWLLLAVHLLLPDGARARLESWVGRSERSLPLSTWLMWGFVGFGVARLALDVWSVLQTG